MLIAFIYTLNTYPSSFFPRPVTTADYPEKDKKFPVTFEKVPVTTQKTPENQSIKKCYCGDVDDLIVLMQREK